MKLGNNDISSVKIGSTDVNKIYIGSTEVWSSFTGLLDTYSGAAAAYSLRQLKSGVTNAIRVRRASDNAESDIGFVSGQLDTTTLETFCSGTDGFVTTWYDQSGNVNDASQSTAASQPQIVSSGSVITMSSKPSLESSTSALNLTTSLTPSDFSIIHVNEGQGFFAKIGDYIRITSTYYRYNFGGNDYISTDVNSAQPSIYIGNRNGTTLNLRRNNYEMENSPFICVTDTLQIQSILSRATLYFVGKCSEFIIYESSQSSNFNGIETNINNFYNIY